MKYELEHDYTKYYTFKPNDTIICLGATVGEFCRTFKDLILDNNIQVINVEPSNDSFKELEEYCDKNIRSAININKGVWSENGNRTLYLSDDPICNMFPVKGHEYLHTPQIGTQWCEVLSLDAILAIVQSDIDLVTCDIEGSEIEVFTNSHDIRKVKQFAIAAYHGINGQESATFLQPFFESIGYETKKENISFHGMGPGFTVLYAFRKD